MEDAGKVDEKIAGSEETEHAGAPAARNREQDAIYQNGKRVAQVSEPEIDLEAKEIRFDEILDCDHLVLADECEFQKYRIMIQKIAFATKLDRRPGHQGRTLSGCTAEILGHIEQ